MAVDVGLGNWLYQRARRSPNRRALTFEGSTWTYAELQERIDRCASALRAQGVCHGDRVGFIGFNQPAFLVTLFGAARIGAIFVPLNFRLTGPELAYIIGDAGVHTLVADGPHRPVIDGIRRELPCRAYWSADEAAEGWPALDDLARAQVPVAHGEPVDADEVAVIMYTSGTTGRPKGAMLTHGNFWWNNTNALLQLDILEDDVDLVVAPLFHIGGLNVTTLITLQKGGELVLHRGFDPARFLEDVPRYGITTTFAVPAMLLFVSQHPAFDSTDLNSLRLIVCGGAPVPEPLMKLYNGRGIPINQGYGLTETAPMVTFLTSEHGLAKLGSAGTTPAFTEVRIIDGDGTVLTEPMARGEVCVKGPNVMKGYWNKPEATAAAIDAEGWFHTGDVGYLDEDGFLFIADRVKDMVITGGENVYPAEVESVLYEHPTIAEVAVVGLPDERWGEAVVAVVALKPGDTLTLDELRSWATDRLARYKLPTRLEVVDALPRNPAGKVLKFELREKFTAAD
ncbi:MAG TPA: long-chain fatty acid--CoA ligase [Acidimicrobiales bacterium]